MPVVVLKTLLKPVEIPQVQFSDKVADVPVVVLKTQVPGVPVSPGSQTPGLIRHM